MLRDDGSGYIQICNSNGHIFGSVMFEPGFEDVVCVIYTTEPFDVSMRWFMVN